MRIKLFIILILIVALIAIFAKDGNVDIKRHSNTLTKVGSVIPTSGTLCFERNEKATTDAPYNVSENIKLNFDGTKISGTKEGTQSGPDMTNGYQGTLQGTSKGSEMELEFAYTIEGSSSKELEVYELSNGTSVKSLVKKRWPLTIDTENEILVPEREETPTLISYEAKDCK